MLVLEILLVVEFFVVSVIGTLPQSATDSQQRREWQEILQNYDNSIQPNGTNGGPVIVKVEIFIRDIELIDETTMKWTIHLTLILHWSDSRLKSTISENSYPIQESLFQKIWMPNLFFVDGWDSMRYSVLGKNTDFTQLKLEANDKGDMMLTVKTFLTLGSPMEFKNYPFNNQICRLTISSDKVIVSWINSDPVKITNNLKLTNFAFLHLKTSSCSDHDDLLNENNTLQDGTPSSSSSCLILECVFERETSFYYSILFIPSITVFTIVWLSLFLDPLDSSGTRSIILASSIITGTLLGCCFFLINNNNVPALYSTALGRWTAVCQAFYVVAVLEFVAVHRLALRQKKREQFEAKINFETENVQNLADNANVQKEQENEAMKLELHNLTVKRKWHVTVDILFRINYLLAFLVFNLRYYFTHVNLQ